MRLFYFILKFTLKISLWVYYPRKKILNSDKRNFTRTIYVSNHTASFMDPLTIAGTQSPIVFFMTRSDVFKPLLKPILWASHMLPIYRSLDGKDTKAKNDEVFKQCNRILKFGRSLLIFGEGFTDDEPIRRLKPVKKGAVRIGFGALENMDWKHPVFLQAQGASYELPNKIGSDLVISTGEPICLNAYKKAYEQNPNKVINELTKRIELEMREQIIDVRDLDWTDFHERVMIITRQGMAPDNSDKRIDLLERWKYAKRLATWMNEQELNENEDLIGLKKEQESYFSLLKKLKIEEKYLHSFSTGENPKRKDLWFFILSIPAMPLAFLHCFIPYLFVKRLTEKAFKRKVFWGSTKMMLGKLFGAIYNVPFLFLFYHFVFPSYLVAAVYCIFTPILTGLLTYNAFGRLKDYKVKSKMNSKNLASILNKRESLIETTKRLITVK